MKRSQVGKGVAAGALAAACFLAAEVGGQDGALDATRAAVQQRIELERVLSKEKLDWAVGRELLQSRIDLTGRQIQSLRDGIAESRRGALELGAKRAELEAERDRLKDASQALADLVPELERRTKALLPRLPAPLAERVMPLYRRIPEDPATTTASLSERCMNVVGILNQVNKFNREVLATSEVLELAGGKTAEVTALYVGLGGAFYATADGASAGIGSVGADGREWRTADEHAAAIARAIAVLENERPAEFVRLPVSVD